MAITVNGSSAPASWTTTPDPYTFTTAQYSAQRQGGIVWIAQTGAVTDQITSVTLGGVAMTRVDTNGFATDSAGETGAMYCYFLGSGIPVNATTTISIDHTAGSGTKRACLVVLNAAADLEIVASGKLEGDRANPQIALDSGAREAMRLAGAFSGLANVTDLTEVAGYENTNAAVDFGQQVATFANQTSNSSGSSTIGWTSSSDDVAMVAIAVAEVSAAAAEIPILVMPQMRAR